MFQALLLTSSLALAAPAPSPPPPDRPYLAAAVEAGRWLRSVELSGADGLVWPYTPGDSTTHGDGQLYGGSAGIVLFFRELSRVTGDPSWLAAARRGADYLLATLPATLDDRTGAGLYSGVGGTAFALGELHRATGEPRYRDGAKRIVRLIEEGAKPVGEGVEWSSTTDVVSGTAGTGLFLLYAAKNLDEPRALALARRAGLRLIALGEAAQGGLDWPMDPSLARRMPNFSHGTAGIGYFLAALYLETKEKPFLDAAVAAGTYLTQISRAKGSGCVIPHHFPEEGELYYYSWCHGPAGTGRFFYRLHEATGDESWLRWLDKGNTALLESGIPEQRPEGFWNNVGACCGNAGVGSFLLGLDRARGTKAHRPFVERLAKDLLARATRTPSGWKWIQAEHRSRPQELFAQSGLMQGAAGIGLFLLDLDAFDRGTRLGLRLPDTPF